MSFDILLQPLAAVEHSGAEMDSVSDLLTVAMVLENALVAVMRSDVVVVSYNSF